MIALLLTGYVTIGVIVAVLFAEHVGDLVLLDFLLIVGVWPLVLVWGLP